MSGIPAKTSCLTQLVQSKKCLSISESVQIFRGLLIMLDKLHEAGKILLWLNPDSIQITEVNGKYLTAVRMCSWQTVDRDAIEERKASVGFRAPEVALRDTAHIGKQSDYYSATAIFYYCLTGTKMSNLQMFFSKIPNLPDTMAGIDERTREQVQAILRKGLAYNLRRRYRSTAEIQEDLMDVEKCIHRR